MRIVYKDAVSATNRIDYNLREQARREMANRNERKYRFYGTLIYWILRLISVTTKLHVYREKNYNQKEAYIYAGWHQKIFLPVLSLTEVEKKQP